MKTTRRSFLKKSALLPASLAVGANLVTRSLINAEGGTSDTSCATSCWADLVQADMVLTEDNQNIVFWGSMFVWGQSCFPDPPVQCVYSLTLVRLNVVTTLFEVVDTVLATAVFNTCPHTTTTLQASGSYHSNVPLRDLDNYAVAWRTPVCSNFLG